jgi:hypothetical protein
VLTTGKPSAQVTRYANVTGAVTVYANLEVLSGSIETFADSTNSFLEAVVIPR